MANAGLIALMTGLLLWMPSMASAQELPAGKWWRDPQVVQRLELSGPEIDRLEQAYVESRRQLIHGKGDMEAERFELETLFGKNNFNENAARQQFERLEQKRSTLSQSLFQFVVQVRKILGPERFQRLVDFYQHAPSRSFPQKREKGRIR